jgi:hypothetical protein
LLSELFLTRAIVGCLHPCGNCSPPRLGESADYTTTENYATLLGLSTVTDGFYQPLTAEGDEFYARQAFSHTCGRTAADEVVVPTVHPSRVYTVRAFKRCDCCEHRAVGLQVMQQVVVSGKRRRRGATSGGDGDDVGGGGGGGGATVGDADDGGGDGGGEDPEEDLVLEWRPCGSVSTEQDAVCNDDVGPENQFWSRNCDHTADTRAIKVVRVETSTEHTDDVDFRSVDLPEIEAFGAIFLQRLHAKTGKRRRRGVTPGGGGGDDDGGGGIGGGATVGDADDDGGDDGSEDAEEDLSALLATYSDDTVAAEIPDDFCTRSGSESEAEVVHTLIIVSCTVSTTTTTETTTSTTASKETTSAATCTDTDGEGTPFRCSAGFQTSAFVGKTVCSGTICKASDCCVAIPTCTDSGQGTAYECGNGFAKVDAFNSVTCEGIRCEADECCEKEESQSTNPTCAETGFSCGNYMFTRSAAFESTVCASAQCKIADCCVTNPTCANTGEGAAYKCGNGYTKVADFEFLVCTANECFAEECCEEEDPGNDKPKCADADADGPQFSCSAGFVPSDVFGSTVCSGNRCKASDCCVVTPTCTDSGQGAAYECGSGFAKVDAFNSAICESYACTITDCCVSTDDTGRQSDDKEPTDDINGQNDDNNGVNGGNNGVNDDKNGVNDDDNGVNDDSELTDDTGDAKDSGSTNGSTKNNGNVVLAVVCTVIVLVAVVAATMLFFHQKRSGAAQMETVASRASRTYHNDAYEIGSGGQATAPPSSFAEWGGAPRSPVSSARSGGSSYLTVAAQESARVPDNAPAAARKQTYTVPLEPEAGSSSVGRPTQVTVFRFGAVDHSKENGDGEADC